MEQPEAIDLTIITNIGKLYAPHLIASADVVIGGATILGLVKDTTSLQRLPGVAVLDARKGIVVPGFVDNHIHVTGGGGELGPESRCPEAQLSQLFDAGITTAVGILGTDSASRSQEALIAKVMALRRDGLDAYHWMGAYRVPLRTLTGDVQRDLLVLPTCLGVGEVAVGDHRSSLPSIHELARIAMEARVGGMVGGKAGLVCFHMGAAADRMDLVNAVVNAGVPIQQLLLTHMERPEVAGSVKTWGEEALQWLQQGGWCDFTAGHDAVNALQHIRSNAPHLLHACSVSSDSFGSYPTYDAQGHLLKYKMTLPDNLLELLWTLHVECDWPLEDVLPLLTTHPATRLGLRAGTLARGAPADLLVLDGEYAAEPWAAPTWVVAQGRVVRTPQWTQSGMFEQGQRNRRFALDVGNVERLKANVL